MVWLAINDRLSTGVRMKSWGLEQSCVFCGERNEDRDHLFFTCPYTFTVWMNIAHKLLGEAITPDWEGTVITLLQPSRHKLDIILLRLAFQSAIYTLWRERNSRRHGGPCVAVAMTTRTIGKLVKNRIISLKYKGTHKLEGLIRRWFEVYSY